MMSKAELVEKIAEGSPYTKKEIACLFEEFIEAISGSLERGVAVNLHQLGRLYVREVQPRSARNPRTGEQMFLPAKRRVILRPAKVLKDRLNRAEDK